MTHVFRMLPCLFAALSGAFGKRSRAVLHLTPQAKIPLVLPTSSRTVLPQVGARAPHTAASMGALAAGHVSFAADGPAVQRRVAVHARADGGVPRDSESSRRAVIGAAIPGILGAAGTAHAAGEKYVVLGGSGFVGRRICERLADAGAEVVSISRTGGPPPGTGPWTGKVRWVKGDVLSMDLAAEVKGASAVISAIGAIGSGADAVLNGATAENGVEAAAKAGVPRFVLVSATPLVAESGIGGFFPGYVEGKQRAEAAVASFPGKSLVLQPTFIFGGNDFSINPPRVAGDYGALVETVLGSPPVRAVASVSPAALKLALLPPNAVMDVAAAAVAGAQGRATGVLSSHDDIQAAAAAP